MFGCLRVQSWALQFANKISRDPLNLLRFINFGYEGLDFAWDLFGFPCALSFSLLFFCFSHRGSANCAFRAFLKFKIFKYPLSVLATEIKFTMNWLILAYQSLIVIMVLDLYLHCIFCIKQ